MILDTVKFDYICPYCDKKIFTRFEDDYGEIVRCYLCDEKFVAQINVDVSLTVWKLKKGKEVEILN